MKAAPMSTAPSPSCGMYTRLGRNARKRSSAVNYVCSKVLASRFLQSETQDS